jgi:hypothetical protein
MEVQLDGPVTVVPLIGALGAMDVMDHYLHVSNRQAAAEFPQIEGYLSSDCCNPGGWITNSACARILRYGSICKCTWMVRLP